MSCDEGLKLGDWFSVSQKFKLSRRSDQVINHNVSIGATTNKLCIFIAEYDRGYRCSMELKAVNLLECRHRHLSLALVWFAEVENEQRSILVADG